MPNPKLRYAKRSDVVAVYGETNVRSMKAIVAELDGRIIGLGGYYFTPEHHLYAFGHVTDELRKYPVTLYRAGLIINEMLKKVGHAKAIADNTQEASGRFLEHLGYTKVGESGLGDIYEWRNHG